MKSSVYVLRGETGPVKVGFSNYPATRAYELGGESLSVAFAAAIDGDHRAVEREAHLILREKRVRGEWFDATQSEAIAAVREAASRLGFDIVESNEPSSTLRPSNGKPTSDPISNFRIPLPIREFLEACAEQDGRTYSGLVIKILTDWAKQKGFKG